MNLEARALKVVQIWGSVQMLILFVMASVLYLERGTFMDVAFQTFEMIRSEQLAPQVYRFGSAFTQIFPLLAIKLKAPLWCVAYMYSVGVVLYQSVLFFYIAFIRKNIILAYAFLMYLCLMTTHSFFWIQSEFSQSIPFGFALLAFLLSLPKNNMGLYNGFILGLGIVTAVFFHPLQAPLILLFILISSFAEGLNRNSLIAIVMILIAWGTKQIGFSNWYDNMAGERLDALKEFKLNGVFTLGLKQFLQQGTYYFPVLALLFINVFRLVQTKQFFYALLLTIGCGLYFFFIQLTHPIADVFYIENLLLAIPAVLSLVWAYLGFKTIQTAITRFWTLILIAFVFIFILRIQHVSAYYYKRIEIYSDLIKNHKHQKTMLPEKELPKPYLLFAWPSAYEVWMLSTIQHQQTASLVFISDSLYYRQSVMPNKQFRGLRNYPYDSLKAPYFIWTDTVSSYSMK